MTKVPSARAETSCQLLMRTVGGYQSQVLSFVPPRASRLPSRGHDRIAVAQQASIIRLASITEAFCVDALIEAAEELGQPGSSTTMQTIWEESVINATRSWPAQQKAYKDWLDLKIKWETIDAMATARNAIAHGLGALTRRQLRKPHLAKTQLARLDIGLNGSDLILSDQSVRGLAHKCRDFILDLDSQLATRLQNP